jgi:TatD DNase family protein
MTQLFDTHAHLDSEELFGDLPDILSRAAEAGVKQILAVGISAASSQAVVKLAQNSSQEFAQRATTSGQSRVYAAVGIQPNYVHEAQPGDWAKIVELSDEKDVIAIGETGLDNYWDWAPPELQRDYFDKHIRLSQQTGLPFIVHLRESEEDILRMLTEARRRGPLAGIMHSYTGSLAFVQQFLELGLHISFAGMVTFKKSDELREVAKAVPLDRLLVETDAPYLSPHPLRGKNPNEPARVAHTAACLANLHAMSEKEFGELTTANAKRLFELED